jgi:hypothetical protein
MNVSLADGALACWLLAEILGAHMAATWVTSGAARVRKARPDGMSLPVLAGHAGLNLAGLACWMAFLATGSAAAGWLALAFMAPAIGLGVSTVSVWTPYPAGRTATAPAAGPAGRAIPEERLARAIEDETAASRLADDLLQRNLAAEPQPARRLVPLDARAFVPLAHGVLAVATFLLATLAAVSAS